MLDILIPRSHISQVAEYRRLKAEVEKRCTVVSTDLDNKRREQEAAINSNEFDKRRLQHSQEKLQQRDKAVETERRNLESLREAERNYGRTLEEEKKRLKELQEEVGPGD
jgi:hypothetical protein